MKGSWAGATGYPQSCRPRSCGLPPTATATASPYLRSEADGLASIAAYLRDAGWKPNVHWGIPVSVPASLNRAAIVSRLVAPRCERVYARHSQWKTMREWRALGVRPLGRALPESEMASLIEPDGRNATAYLLTTNYRTILDYNSELLRSSVGLLAHAFVSRDAPRAGRGHSLDKPNCPLQHRADKSMFVPPFPAAPRFPCLGRPAKAPHSIRRPPSPI